MYDAEHYLSHFHFLINTSWVQSAFWKSNSKGWNKKILSENTQYSIGMGSTIGN